MSNDEFEKVREFFEKTMSENKDLIPDIMLHYMNFLKLRTEEATKRAIADSEMNQKFWDTFLQLQNMRSLMCSPPENKPSQNPRTPKAEMSGESESMRPTH